MKSFQHYRERLNSMDFYDYLRHADRLFYAIKGRIFYTLLFGKFGRRSWLKPPDEIINPSHIFVDDDVHIEKGAILYAVKRYGDAPHTGRITIGQRTYISRYFNASSACKIDIGEDVNFGRNVFVCDFDHSYSEPGTSRITSPLIVKGPITIGDRCWLGANVYIASGVDLGEGCVVGANSVVTSSFPPNTVLAGAPAKAIRQFDRNSGQWRRLPLEPQSTTTATPLIE